MLYTVLMYLSAWLFTGFSVSFLIETFDKNVKEPYSRVKYVQLTCIGPIVIFLYLLLITYDWLDSSRDWWDKPLLPTRSPRLVIQTGSGPFGKTVLSVLVCLPVAFCVWLCQIYSVDQAVSALVGTVLGQITGFVIFLIWYKD